jgi:hypothetical protein
MSLFGVPRGTFSRRRKLLALLLIALFVVAAGFAVSISRTPTTGPLSIQLWDALQNKPVNGTVILVNIGHQHTDSNGIATFIEPLNRLYQFVVSAAGYIPYNSTATPNFPVKVVMAPSPGRTTTVEPGSLVKACLAIVTKDGSQAVGLDGFLGTNSKVTGSDATVIQDALNNILDSGRTQKERLCLEGSFSFGTNPTLITLPSFTILDFSGAYSSVESDLSTTNTKLFLGTSVTDIDVVSGIFDGLVGTSSSNVEPFNFFQFTGSQRINFDYLTSKNISGRLINFQPPANSYISISHLKETDGNDGGAGGTFDTVTYGEMAFNQGYYWDSGPLIARSNHINIHDNMWTAQKNVCIDLIIQASTDIFGNITLRNNHCMGSYSAALGAYLGISIHDTGSSGTSAPFRELTVESNDVDGGNNGYCIKLVLSQPVLGFKIRSNNLHNCLDGILEGPFGSTPALTQSGMQITDNAMWALGVPGAGGGGAGIWFRGGPENNTLVSGNQITDCNGGDTSVCIYFENGIYNSRIVNNIIGPFTIGSQASRSVQRPMFWSTGTGNWIIGNDLSGTTSGISSVTGSILVNNRGYNPQPTRSVTAGTSPYTYTNNDPYYEQLVLTTAGGISAYTCKGGIQAQTIGVPTPILSPTDSCIFTWTTTAPVFQVDPQ